MNSKSKAVRYYWDFGDSSAIDTTQNPSHIYTKAGVYRIRLVCEDTNTCNRFDTVYDEVTLLDNSTALFTYEVSYCENTVSLKNNSKNQINFLWDFGDGTFDTITENPVHKYTGSGVYKIRLLVNRNFTCSDSIETTLDFALFKPTAPIIPNVFTPNGDGNNDSFAIGGINPHCDKFEMTVYNRWGQVVFETKEVGKWWDGKHKEVPMYDGIYYFTLEVTDFKGTVTKHKGEVTIIR